ncbi:MAG: hypothetical protein FWD57_17270 [Polyangiaceae bacterium]|nr:hypothetical protein [Polyangiaceae bacterium]
MSKNTWLTILAASAVVFGLAACEVTSDDDPGGDGGTGGEGGTGGGGNGGDGGSGAGGPGTPCDKCVDETECKTEYDACMTEDDCKDTLACIAEECTADLDDDAYWACVDSCADEYISAGYNDYEMCANDARGGACYDKCVGPVVTCDECRIEACKTEYAACTADTECSEVLDCIEAECADIDINDNDAYFECQDDCAQFNELFNDYDVCTGEALTTCADVCG